MTTPTLYIIDDGGDLATYTGPLGVSLKDGNVEVACDNAGRVYVCDSTAAALALRDAITSALTRAALAGRPCCVVDMCDIDGAKAEAAKRERVAAARASIGRK